jgi:hypothetical protein
MVNKRISDQSAVSERDGTAHGKWCRPDNRVQADRTYVRLGRAFERLKDEEKKRQALMFGKSR